MKGRGIKLLHLWVALILVNTAIPALCAGLAASGLCGPKVTATTAMSCEACPQAQSQQPTSVPDCCEIRARDLCTSWHQERPITVASFTLILATVPHFEITAPSHVTESSIAERAVKLQECDVGNHKPRAPPIACV